MGLEVGQVVLRRPRRIRLGSQQFFNFSKPSLAAAIQKGRGNDDALLGERLGQGRHRAGADSAKFSVVCAVGHVAEELLGVIEHRADHGDVRQMRAAVAGMVGDDHVAGAKRLAKRNRAHTEAKGPEMHRNVRRVDNKLAVAIEQRAGVVETFLDVGRDRGALQQLPHLLDDRAEPIREQFQLDEWRVGAVTAFGCLGRASQFESTLGAKRAGPAGVNTEGAKTILHDCRPLDALADVQRLAVEDWLVDRLSRWIGKRFRRNRRRICRGDDPRRDDLDRFVVWPVAEKVFVPLAERRSQVDRCIEGDFLGGFLPFVAQRNEAAADNDLFVGKAFSLQ